jgi:hypothetical protein
MWAWTYEGNAPQFHNCLVQYGLENISGYENIQVYENCLDEDPLFSGLAPDEFSIWLESPCVNAGSPDTPVEILEGYDLGGQPRVWDGIIDIGAYEVDPTGIQEIAKNESLIRIAGNPITASSYAEIELENDGIVSARVYSTEGKLLVSKYLGEAHAGNNQFAIGELFTPLSAGAYLLVVQAEGKTFVAKVIR